MNIEIIGGIQRRIEVTIIYGMVCALEIRGLLFALAGKTVLEVPLWWKVAFFAFGVWQCWEFFILKYRKIGLSLALAATVWEGFGLAGFFETFGHVFFKHKILEQPSQSEIVIYVLIAAVFLWVVFAQGRRKGTQPKLADRVALLMGATYCVIKACMGFVAGNQAITLKEAGCIALVAGTIATFQGLLQSFSPQESEFPVAQNSAS